MAGDLTRRQLGKAALAGSVMLPGRGSADGTLTEERFDPVHWTLELYKSAPLRLTFKATNKTEAEVWQRQLRAKLTELLGGFPSVRGPLRGQMLESTEPGRYRRQKFIFESRPGLEVLGYLLTPLDAKPPYATVVCVPGHGFGVDDIVGIDQNGNDRGGKPGYEHDYAIQAVEHGLAAVAIEPLAFGCRRDAVTKKKGPREAACMPAAGAALLLGQTMIGWRVWDVMRTVDWIQERPELDAKRVGCMGISGGGTVTQFAAALDERIKAAFVSGYLNTFRDSIMSMAHCIDNYVPGILNWAENHDVASLIAPRYFFSEGGDHDPIFPIHGTREGFARVKKAYQVFGAPEHAEQEIFEGEHWFHGVRGLPFMVKALG